MSATGSKKFSHLNLKGLHQYHPYLTALFPILALYTHNIREVEFSLIVRSLIITFLATTTLLVVYRLLFRDFGESALACTFSLILFFSYGQIYAMLKEVSIFDVLIGRHRILTPLWLVLFVFGMVYIARRRRKNDVAHRTISLIMLIALISPTYLIVEFFVHTSLLTHQPEVFDNTQINPVDDVLSIELIPDIYYIILDGYTRQDTLREFYNYDNQSFIHCSVSELMRQIVA